MAAHPHSWIGRGALAGAAGGLLGTLAMSYAQHLWTLAADGDAPSSAGGKHDAREWQERTEGADARGDNSTAVRRRRMTGTY